MKTSTFLAQLAVLSLLSFAALWGLHRIPALQSHQGLSWASATLLLLFSLLLFAMGKMAAKSSNDHLFIQLFLVATALKMAVCIGLVWWYFSTYQPPSNLFVLPFFAVYAVYTVFEMYFLGKLGKKEADPVL